MSIELAPISKLKLLFDKVFGKNEWLDLEPETIIMSLDLPFSDLLHDKVYLLKILCSDAGIFYEDFAFALYAIEVINNRVADFSSIPSVTSLELAFAIVEVPLVTGGVPDYSNLIPALSYILREEGYSKPVAPFSFIPESNLEAGQTDKDISDKEMAIKLYIHNMNKDGE